MNFRERRPYWVVLTEATKKFLYIQCTFNVHNCFEHFENVEICG